MNFETPLEVMTTFKRPKLASPSSELLFRVEQHHDNAYNIVFETWQK